MKMTMFGAAAIAASLTACGSSTETEMVAGFDPPAAPAGYTRYVTPIVRNIPAGGDVTYCQWITAPADRDLTVANFNGGQSSFGHHLTLYSNSFTPPVGTSRECGPNDMLSVRFVGGTPGEGKSTYVVPEGVVFRVPAGWSLMANIHFINTSQHPIDGQGYIDLLLVDAKPEDKVAGGFANYGGSFAIAPNSTGSADVRCTLKKELSFFLYLNHMHEWGKSAYTELERQNGTKEMLVRSDVWSPEMVFDPTLASFPVDNPIVAHVGDTVHTHCEWNNDTAEEITFPKEMCVGFGFYLPGGTDIDCGDGNWEE